jgi:hypothetical protein
MKRSSISCPLVAPICWTVCGLISGYLSRLTGAEIYILEDRCVSKDNAGLIRERRGAERAPIHTLSLEMKEIVFHFD